MIGILNADLLYSRRINIATDSSFLKGEIMRIDNYALNLEAHAEKSTTVRTSFIDILEVENSSKTQELKSIDEELEFVQRLQFELLNQLMALLKPSSNACQCKLKDMSEFEFPKLREMSTRTIRFEEEHTMSQSLDVQMFGSVISGEKRIDLDIKLSFSSEFTQTHSIEKTMFYDPLVLTFAGDIPDLESKTFDFDIDMDGESDQISMLSKGSGFLALDKNDNGVIDDGFELFGTQNGNGFLDLKRYDKDSNGWIDENDDIFNKLRIWSKNEDEDTLIGLGEAGVGALFLGHAKGDFDIMNDTQTLGRIKSNGLFLNEDGTNGLLTQIDFAKQKLKEANNTSPLSEVLQA